MSRRDHIQADVERTRQQSRVDQLRRTRQGPQAAGGGSAALQMRVKSVGNDTLTCRTWDGTDEGGEDVTVAKPYYLRRTPFHNTTNADGWLLTYTSGAARTATKASEDDVDQVIDPPYASNDLIYVIAPSGGTGVAGATLVDINADAREWAYDCE